MSEIAELFSSESLSQRVAAEVRAHAARRGIQQKDLARQLGLNPSGITHRMRGRVPFTIDEVGKLAEIFGVDVAELMPQTRPAGASAGETPAGARWAIRDLNPEPAGLESPQADTADATSMTLADVIPLSPGRVRRSDERVQPNGRPGRPTFAPHPVHAVVSL